MNNDCRLFSMNMDSGELGLDISAHILRIENGRAVLTIGLRCTVVPIIEEEAKVVAIFLKKTRHDG